MAVYCRAKAGVTLLSLDGGGVKGISSLLILKRIMEKVAVHENRDLEKERLPKDYFDLAGGTSTGGLAALMLFRLGMDTSQAIEQYENLAAKVFAPTFGKYEIHKWPGGYYLGNLWLWLMRIFRGAAFSAKRLEKAIEVVMEDPDRKDCKGTGATKLIDESGKSGMMLMCATVADVGETVLFRSYKQPDDVEPQSETAN